MKKKLMHHTAQPNQAVVLETKLKKPRSDRNHEDAIRSILVMQAEPMHGLWTDEAAFDLHHCWHIRGGGIDWEPLTPANAHEWDGRIHALAEKANQARQSGTFLRLSKTSQTRATWSLPAIAACPVRDETCEHCYALDGWYRLDPSRQIDRVLRLEYLHRLIRENNLMTSVDWMVGELNVLPIDEPFPPPAPATFEHRGGVPCFRWHDSGDLFNEKYARAVFRVCEATPSVAHWLPTRTGRLIQSLVQRGVKIPPNLSVLVSVQSGGALEQIQLQAVRDVLKVQPSSRIGLSYFVNGPAARTVDMRLVEEQFGRRALVCQALTAKAPKDRVCAGCRRCWAANVESPVIYPRS